MKETMGQIIRRLRKEQNLTQEELAELLNISAQAVSKWENDSGMPDISQVVPLSRIFGVSTDMLFGIAGVNDRKEVKKIIENAQKNLSRPLDTTGLLGKYRILQEGLTQYPNNTVLLSECLETGLALAYPENDVYDAYNGKTIYHECVRYANLIISYSRKASEIMRSHMIMVMLHSAYGNFKEALKHIGQFPARADFNIHVMYAYYAHWKKETRREIGSCQYAIMHYIEGMLRSITRLSEAFIGAEQYKAAWKTLETALELIDCIFRDDEVKPPIHYREHGDLYMLLAVAYLKDGESEKALECLEKMADYDLSEYSKIGEDTRTVSPLLGDVSHEFYIKRIDRYDDLISKLTDNRLESLKDNARYQQLLAIVSR